MPPTYLLRLGNVSRKQLVRRPFLADIFPLSIKWCLTTNFLFVFWTELNNEKKEEEYNNLLDWMKGNLPITKSHRWHLRCPACTTDDWGCASSSNLFTASWTGRYTLRQATTAEVLIACDWPPPMWRHQQQPLQTRFVLPPNNIRVGGCTPLVDPTSEQLVSSSYRLLG